MFRIELDVSAPFDSNPNAVLSFFRSQPLKLSENNQVMGLIYMHYIHEHTKTLRAND